MRRRISARLQEQDEKLLREVYQNCQFRLVVHLTDLLGSEDEALDISQEVLIRFYAAIRRGRRIKNPMYFLLRTGNRLAIRHLKKLQRRERTIFQVPEHLSSGLALQEAWSKLRHVWPYLNPRDRLVAKCLTIDQMNSREIVKSTGISRSAVQRKISKIQKLVDTISNEDVRQGKKSGQIRRVIASLGVEEDVDPDER